MTNHRLFVLVLFFSLCVTGADAATRTWKAAPSTAVWSDAGNWVEGSAPVAGDDLVFPATSSTKTVTNDLTAGLAIKSVTFEGPDYVISGNAISLGTGGVGCGASVDGTNEISFDVALTATLAADIQSHICYVNMTGVVSGSFGVTKTGDGQLRFGGANTYTGITTISNGYILANHATGLGAADGTAGTGTVANGGTLQINANIGNEHVTLYGQGYAGNGALQVGSGTHSIAGPVTLGDSSVILLTNTPNELVFNGVVSGSGRFGLRGSGVFTLANPANSFSGTNDIGGSATLKLGASNVIPDATVLSFTTGSGIFDLNNFNETVARVAGSVTVRTRATSVLTINETGNVSSSARYYDTGTVIKSGAGTLTWPFEQFITGLVTAAQGSLIVNGDLPSAVSVTGGVLGGTGDIAQAVTGSGGSIAPGTSPGILAIGGLSANSSTTIAVELNGTTPGTGHDQLDVTGTVSLGGAALTATFGYAPAAGDTYTIIRNDGVDAVTGTFSGLANGATLIVGATPLTVNYAGGDGNDVVLTAGASVPSMSPTLLLLLAMALGGVGLRQLRRQAPPMAR